MKRFIFFLIAVLIVLLVSCASKQDDNKADIIKEKPTIDVNIKIIEGTLADNECKLRIYNKGNETIGFGTKYILMIKNNEIWSELDCKDDWTGEMYFVEAGKTEEVNINFEEHYGKLQRGEYKLLKEIFAESEDTFFYEVRFTLW